MVARRQDYCVYFNADAWTSVTPPFLGDRKITLLNRVRRGLGVRATAEGNRIWPVGLLLVALPLALVMISTGYIPWNNGQAVADEEREGGRDRPDARKDGERKLEGEKRDEPKRPSLDVEK